MTSKTLRLTSDLLDSPIFKSTIGFDHMLREFLNSSNFPAHNSGYPPSNVARITDEDGNVTYEITLAVAGFTEDDIEITVEKNMLTVTGSSTVLEEREGVTVEYVQKGIAERNFTKKWPLSEKLEVEGATLVNGILKITLYTVVPEEDKPVRIQVKSR